VCVFCVGVLCVCVCIVCVCMCECVFVHMYVFVCVIIFEKDRQRGTNIERQAKGDQYRETGREMQVVPDRQRMKWTEKVFI
jgi:hypothetical protein